MNRLVDYPLIMFAVGLPALWAATLAGVWLRRAATRAGAAPTKEFDLIANATLSLLALLIGFTFSLAASRYDQRRTVEAVEANTISTEIQRAELLPAPDAARVRTLLNAYLDERILFFESEGSGADLAQVNQRTDQLERQLWEAVRAPAVTQPSPITSLVVSGMNEVIDSRGYTQAAVWNRVPAAAWWLLTILALCSNTLIGYGTMDSSSWRRLGLVMPLAVSVSFLLIADIDAPRRGLIRVHPENLRSLVQPFRASNG